MFKDIWVCINFCPHSVSVFLFLIRLILFIFCVCVCATKSRKLINNAFVGCDLMQSGINSFRLVWTDGKFTGTHITTCYNHRDQKSFSKCTNLEVGELQEQKTTSGSTPLRQNSNLRLRRPRGGWNWTVEDGHQEPCSGQNHQDDVSRRSDVWCEH